jgi:TonB family protein
MKTNATLAFCAGLLLCGPILAQPAVTPLPWEPLKIVQQPSPIFPFDLIQMGVREGFARIDFTVEADGTMSDRLVVAYSHRPFADSTASALRRWKFQPARVNGVPVAINTSVTVEFQLEGPTLISLTGSEHVVTLFFRLPTGRDGYRPAQVHELDRPPAVMEAPSPMYPESLAASRTGEVTVEFYIDEAGRPRMPGVSRDDDPQLGALAVDALSKWKFEPATARGRPVLVRATQTFAFGGTADRPVN